MGKHTLTTFGKLLTREKLVSNRKISAVLFVVSGFFFVSCSSVNLEENEDNLFSAPIDKSQNRQKANGVKVMEYKIL